MAGLQYLELTQLDGETPVFVPSSTPPAIWPRDDESCRIFVDGAAFDVRGSAEVIAALFIVAGGGGQVRATEDLRIRITEDGKIRITEETEE